MAAKKCPWGTYSTEDGIEGLNDRLRKAKRLKPFPTFEGVERAAKTEERAWGKKRC
jgi:hypothetical protein